MKKFWIWLMTILTLFCFTACDNDSGDAPDAPLTYTIVIERNDREGGTVTGAGEYEAGKIVTLSVTTNEGYSFLGWYENGTRVAETLKYTIAVTADKTFMVKWQENSDGDHWTQIDKIN